MTDQGLNTNVRRSFRFVWRGEQKDISLTLVIALGVIVLNELVCSQNPVGSRTGAVVP